MRSATPRFRAGCLIMLSILTPAVASCGGEGPSLPTPTAVAATTGTEVFDAADCGACHALRHAGATGTFAPDLDEVAPSADRVQQAILTGPGRMPSFQDVLTGQQVGAVAEYVASVAGS